MKSNRMPDVSARPFNLTVERLMNASAEVIYRAWTKQLDLWFAAPGSVIMLGEVDTAFYFARNSRGNVIPHYGRFLSLEPNRLIEITWVNGEGGTLGAETVVTVERDSYGSGTRLRLTHAGFPNEELKNRHEQAWPLVLEQLDKRVSMVD